MNFPVSFLISSSVLCLISCSGNSELRGMEISDINLENDTIILEYDILAETLNNSAKEEESEQFSQYQCSTKPCFRKCCPIGKFLTNRTCKQTETPFNLPDTKGPSLDRFNIINGFNCDPQKQRLLLNPSENYTKDEFVLQPDGQLFVPSGPSYYDPWDYCVDYIDISGYEDDIRALICVKTRDEFTSQYYSIGMIISMVFLLVTFIAYALLPDRNLHGKALMCYVITLFWAYFLLVLIQLYPHKWEDASCKSLGLFCLFFFMVSFFWMNVMSIDIWWAFSGLRGFSGSKKQAERKRFLLYSAYAWGMPLLHVILVICLTLSTSLPPYAWYNPGMGEGKCWFREGIPTLVYFYGPMAILIVANITLFVITACKIKQVKQDTAMLRKDESKKHSYENDKQRFNLYLKLMLAMGVNWIMEIISWAVIWQVGIIPPAVWYLTDFINALYGVLIFIIFVCKRNILKLLKRRYYMLMGKPHLARSMTQTAYSPRTTGSSLSQTVTTDTKGFVNDSSVLTSEVA